MYNHHHVIWGCIQPSGVTPESLVLVLPWDLNAVQLQEIMKWCKHNKHGMERYITYKSIISGKLCFMDMEPIWKVGGFYIYSIADTIALSACSRPKSVELWRIFSSNKNPLQLLTPENFHETPGSTPFPYSPAAYISGQQDGICLGKNHDVLSLRIVRFLLWTAWKHIFVHPGWSIDFQKSRSCGDKISS